MTPTPESPEGLTVEELARLKEVAEKATPGPWSDFDSKAYAGDPDDGDAYVFITTADGCTGEIAAHMLDADARFVAASDPPTTLRLLSQVERLTAERDEARRQGDEYQVFATRLRQDIDRLKEHGAIQCPMGGDDDPDPCRVCGATVAGNDPVHGVCQAGNAFGVEQKARADTLAAENARLREIETTARNLIAHGDITRISIGQFDALAAALSVPSQEGGT